MLCFEQSRQSIVHSYRIFTIRNEAMLAEIKTDLGANFKTGDDSILTLYIEELTAIALDISNKTELGTSLEFFCKDSR